MMRAGNGDAKLSLAEEAAQTKRQGCHSGGVSMPLSGYGSEGGGGSGGRIKEESGFGAVPRAPPALRFGFTLGYFRGHSEGGRGRFLYSCVHLFIAAAAVCPAGGSTTTPVK